MAITLIIVIAVLFLIALLILLWPLLRDGSQAHPPQKTVHFASSPDQYDDEGPDPEYLRRHIGPDAGYSNSDRDPGGSGGSYRH